MKQYLIKELNSEGAVSIFLVMSILAVILAIALGSSFVASTETRLSTSSNESIVAYYAAETGIEEALYDKAKLNKVPRGNRCPGNCPDPACADWGVDVCTVNTLGAANPYCIEVLPITCDIDLITSIKSTGDHKTTRRSIEINLVP